MPRALTWAAGFAISVALHGVVAGVYLLTKTLDPAPRQSGMQSQLQLDTVTAPRQDAVAQEPTADQAQPQTAESTSLDAGAVPQSQAEALTAPATKPQTIEPTGTALPVADPSGDQLPPATVPMSVTQANPAPATKIRPVTAATSTASAVAPTSDTIAFATPTTVTVATVTPQTISVDIASAAPTIVTAATVTPQTTSVASAPVQAATISAAIATIDTATQTPLPASASIAPATLTAAAATALSPQGALIANAPAQGAIIPAALASGPAAQQPPLPASAAIAPATLTAAAATALSLQGAQIANAPAQGAIIPAALASGPTAQQPPLPATSAKAALAWQFQDRVVTDPAAIATIQAFMAPADTNADDVKDDLSSVLSSIDCARLSATFLPETGTLEMRGHIPDPALRDTILSTMQAQVGDGIPVTANLLHLPSPQCGALTGISDVGLPQSTDQFTNDKLIGQTAHAREYGYSEGQRLRFDLAAPDYDAYVYVDYFSADGEVIHLVPNDTIALERLPAKSLIGIGTERPDQPGLRITIGPPFGQEIAVAFAASHPLYEGLRPIVEPAEPYLAFLKSSVAATRDSNPDFKGEWVYFFITTSPATQ